MRNTRIRRSGPAERGFVLVGVIMFVLALTILGLSLYGLSSFEVDFIQDSITHEQAFYDASGGLERAKWILAQKGTLQSVKTGIPDGTSVVYARAWRPDHGMQDSTGAIDWSSSDKIAIRVLAVRTTRQGKLRQGTARSMVECTYTPSQVKNIYYNLLTSSARVAASTDGFVSPILLGNVWQNDQNTSWTGAVLPSVPPNTPGTWVGGNVTLDGVPDPDVTGFLARFPTAPAAGFSHNNAQGGRTFYHLDSGGDVQPTGERVFRGVTGQTVPKNDGQYEVSSSDPHQVIVINGTVIWLIPGGARFSYDVSVSGAGELVIIAGPSTDNPRPPLTKKVGMWIDGGFDPTVPVILISDGTISVSRIHGSVVSSTWLSIFAGDVHVHVDNTINAYALNHPPLLDGLFVDPLVDHELLPNTTPGQNRHLDKVAGTWSVVLKSDPDN